MAITPQIAEICGIHAGDGYLRNDGKRREWDISGGIEEKDYYDNYVIPLFNETFNIRLIGRFFPGRNTYGFVIRDRKIIRFAHDVLGFPYGSKSLKVKVPNFIFDNNCLMSHFLRGYFDTDGHFGCARKKSKNYCNFKRKFHYYPRVTFSTVSCPLSNNLRAIFKLLGLKFCFYAYPPLKKTESLKYRYEFNGYKKVHKFMNSIGTKNPVKMSRYIIWRKFGFCPTNLSYSQRQQILNGNIDPYIFYKGL